MPGVIIRGQPERHTSIKGTDAARGAQATGDRPGPGSQETTRWAETVKEVKGVPLWGYPRDAKHGQASGVSKLEAPDPSGGRSSD